MNVRFLLRLVRLAVFAWWVVIFPYAGVHGQHMNPEKGIWITSADQSYLLRKIEPIQFKDQVASGDVIDLNPSATFQTMDGFGFALTGGSAGLLNQKLGATEKKYLKNSFGWIRPELELVICELASEPQTLMTKYFLTTIYQMAKQTRHS